jgi:prepilin-type N-terminal cleavage/methylation domain-containing protein
MKALNLLKSGSKGFTLVEIIVTLVAAGILGAIFIQFMGTALSASWNAVEIVRDEAGSEGVIERIISDYVEEMNSNPGTALGTLVTNNTNGNYGPNVTMAYIEFDAAGDEIPSVGSDNLKVVIRMIGPASPAISGRFPLTMILTNSRDTNDPLIFY